VKQPRGPMRQSDVSRRQLLVRVLVLAGFLTGSQRTPVAAEDLIPRMRAAGFKSLPDGTYVWSKGAAAVHLVPGLPLRRPACLEVQVGTQKEGTAAHLDLTTPEMVRLAVETLRGPEASLAFEYVVQGSAVKPSALREAMIRWAETAPWPTIGEHSKPEALAGFEGWLVVGARTYKPGTRLTFGIARPV
jgi:hypothetical protein